MCLPAFGLTIACAPKKPQGIQPGDELQSAQARSGMDAGIAHIGSFKADVMAMVSGYRDSQPAQAILPATLQIPLNPVTNAQMQSFAGTYSQTGVGAFSFVAGASNSITIEYLNGVDLVFNLMAYNDANNLEAVRVNFSSHNRGIETPPAEEIIGYFSIARSDHTDHIASLNSYSYRFASQFGLIFTDSTGVSAKHGFDFYESIKTTSRLGGITIDSDHHDRVWNPTNLRTGSFELRTTKQYKLSEITKTYAALEVNRYYKDKVDGNSLDYSAQLLLDDDDGIRIGLTGYVGYLPGNSVALYTIDGETVEVAALSGGPYECNLITPTALGTGPANDMAWNNGTTEGILPGYVDCLGIMIRI